MDQPLPSITHINRLPAIPVIAKEIIHLVSDPHSSADQLAKLIEKDPSMSAQIMRYARSPFFGYRGKIDSIQDAISRVLGFDIVSNIAFGIASSHAFNLPVGGPVGLASLWHQSLMSATLAQTLARELKDRELPSGMAYLTCLLQHFGLLALGHLQPEHYVTFNDRVKETGQYTDALHEQPWDYEPSEMGAALLMHWNMPDEVVSVVRQLQSQHPTVEYERLVQFVRLVNGLLSEQGVGLPSFDWQLDDNATVLGVDLAHFRTLTMDCTLQTGEIDALVERLVAGAGAR